jgi:hypothetical protein
MGILIKCEYCGCFDLRQKPFEEIFNGENEWVLYCFKCAKSPKSPQEWGKELALKCLNKLGGSCGRERK